MKGSGCRTFGVVMRQNAPEYLLWAVVQPGPEACELSHVNVQNESKIHASPDFDPCGIILFEMTDTDFINQTTYPQSLRRQAGETVPFSLFLKPGFGVKGME